MAQMRMPPKPKGRDTIMREMKVILRAVTILQVAQIDEGLIDAKEYNASWALLKSWLLDAAPSAPAGGENDASSSPS